MNDGRTVENTYGKKTPDDFIRGRRQGIELDEKFPVFPSVLTFRESRAIMEKKSLLGHSI